MKEIRKVGNECVTNYDIDRSKELGSGSEQRVQVGPSTRWRDMTFKD